MTERGTAAGAAGRAGAGPGGPTSARGRRPLVGALRRDGICRGSVRCCRGADHHHHDAPRRRAAHRARARWPDPADRSRRGAAAGGSAPHPVVPQRGSAFSAPTRRRSASSSPPCGSAVVGLPPGLPAHGTGPRAAGGTDARGRPPPAVPQQGGQRLGRPLAARLSRRSRRPTQYRRAHMAHHREEFGPDEPDMALYVGYPIPAPIRCAASSGRDATGQTGWKLLKGLFRATRSATPARGAPPARSSRCSSGSSAISALAGYPLVYLLLWFAAVHDRVAGHQPAALDRRARRHDALERPPPDHPLGAPALAGALRASSRTTSAGTSPTTCDSGYPDAPPAPLPPRAACARATSPTAWSTPATRRSGGRSRPGRPARRPLRRRRSAAAQA